MIRLVVETVAVFAAFILAALVGAVAVQSFAEWRLATPDTWTESGRGAFAVVTLCWGIVATGTFLCFRME